MNKSGEGLNWPLVTAKRLTVAIPVAMWAITAIGGVNMTILLLNDLVLVVSKVFLCVEKRIVDWLWSPVSVILLPLLLISLLSC